VCAFLDIQKYTSIKFFLMKSYLHQIVKIILLLFYLFLNVFIIFSNLNKRAGKCYLQSLYTIFGLIFFGPNLWEYIICCVLLIIHILSYF